MKAINTTKSPVCSYYLCSLVFIDPHPLHTTYHTYNMKQKIVVKVQISCEKCRTKARKIAAETDGVGSLAIEGADRDQVVVTGDGIDSANLTHTLRKKVGFATIVSVQKVEDKMEEKTEPLIPSSYSQYLQCTTPTFHQVVYDPTPSICSIMR